MNRKFKKIMGYIGIFILSYVLSFMYLFGVTLLLNRFELISAGACLYIPGLLGLIFSIVILI